MVPSSEFFTQTIAPDLQERAPMEGRNVGDSHSDSGVGKQSQTQQQWSGRNGMSHSNSLTNLLGLRGAQAQTAILSSARHSIAGGMVPPPPPPSTSPAPSVTQGIGMTGNASAINQGFVETQEAYGARPAAATSGTVSSHAFGRALAKTSHQIRNKHAQSVVPRPVSYSRGLLPLDPRQSLYSGTGPKASISGRASMFSRRGTNFGSIATDGDLESTCSWGSDDIPEPEDVCDRGLAVSLIVMLMSQYDLGHKSVREVVEDFVLPETDESGMSVAGVMKRYYSDYIGTSGFYVSYPWDANFGRLVKALSAVDAAAGGGNYFWLDIFALDQHGHMQGYTGAENEQWMHRDEMLNTVRYAITSVGRTVAFLDPPCAPKLVERSWCLYECMQSLETNAELVLCVTPEPPDLDSMGSLSENIEKTIAAFTPKFEDSETWQVRDKNWLKSAVAALHPGGSRYLNEQVGAVLLGWLCDRLQEEFGTMSLSHADYTLVESVHRLGILCEKLDRVDEAETNLLSALREAEARVLESGIDIEIDMVHGDDDFIVTSPQAGGGSKGGQDCDDNCSELTSPKQTEYSTPKETEISPSKRTRKVRSRSSRSRVSTQDDEDATSGSDAAAHNDDSDDQTQSDGGSPHNWTVLLVQIKHDLACLWAKNFERFKDAEIMLRETLATREQILGRADSRTTETVTALARLLQAQKKYDEAESLFRRALSRDISTKGSKHRDTLVTANCLALLLQKRGGLDEAKVLFERALQAGLATLGPRHPDVLVWSNNLAVLYQDKKLYMKAERLFRKTLTHSEQELGPMHPRTLNIVYNLGHSLWQMGKLRAAETMFRRELLGCEQVNGPRHRSTRRSIKNLAKLLRVQCRKEESEQLLLRISQPEVSKLARQLSETSISTAGGSVPGLTRQHSDDAITGGKTVMKEQ